MMSTGAIILIVVVVIAVAVVAWLVRMQMRRRHLQERFGSEYDKAMESGDNRRAAERELTEREKRHADYDIQPLPEAERERFSVEWRLIQQQFVDQPGAAVAEADRLVTVVMGERGYPTEGYQQRVSDLSVRHSSTLDHYRTAHDIKSRHDESRASTEELREAMVHYRSMFEDLLDADQDRQTRRNRN